MVNLNIKIYRDKADESIFNAELSVDKDEILCGHGDNPYRALWDLINEMEYHQYFRADNN